MLKLTTENYDHGTKKVVYGDIAHLKSVLLDEHPGIATESMTLGMMVRTINDAGFYSVKVEDVSFNNQLPEDYVTHDQGDDPWVREGDDD